MSEKRYYICDNDVNDSGWRREYIHLNTFIDKLNDKFPELINKINDYLTANKLNAEDYIVDFTIDLIHEEGIGEYGQVAHIFVDNENRDLNKELTDIMESYLYPENPEMTSNYEFEKAILDMFGYDNHNTLVEAEKNDTAVKDAEVPEWLKNNKAVDVQNDLRAMIQPLLKKIIDNVTKSVTYEKLTNNRVLKFGDRTTIKYIDTNFDVQENGIDLAFVMDRDNGGFYMNITPNQDVFNKYIVELGDKYNVYNAPITFNIKSYNVKNDEDIKKAIEEFCESMFDRIEEVVTFRVNHPRRDSVSDLEKAYEKVKDMQLNNFPFDLIVKKFKENLNDRIDREKVNEKAVRYTYKFDNYPMSIEFSMHCQNRPEWEEAEYSPLFAELSIEAPNAKDLVLNEIVARSDADIQKYLLKGLEEIPENNL